MADSLMDRVREIMAANYESVTDGATVIEGISKLLGIEPTEDNERGLAGLVRAGTARVPLYLQAMGPYAPYCAGFLAGVEFAVAARLALEEDPR